MIKFFEKPKGLKSEQSPEPLENETNQLKVQWAQSQADLVAAHKDFSLLKGQMEELQTELSKERRQSGEWATKLGAQSSTHKREIESLNAALEKKQLEFESSRQASAAKDEDLKKVRLENDALSDQLLQSNAAYVELDLRLNQLEAEKKSLEDFLSLANNEVNNAAKALDANRELLAQKSQALDKANAELEKLEKQFQSKFEQQVSDLKSALVSKEHGFNLAQAESQKLADELSAGYSQAKQQQEELSGLRSEHQAVMFAVEQRDEELNSLRAQVAQLQDQLALKSKDQNQSLQDQASAHQDLVYQLENVRAQLNAIVSDTNNDQEMLVLQIAQLQDESSTYYEEKRQLEKLYKVYRARWERLEKRIPNLIDFGALTVVEVDTVSEVPSVVWGVSDFAQTGITLPNFNFATVLVEGQPGIVLVGEGQPDFVSGALVPKNLATDPNQVSLFMQLTASQYKQLDAAIKTLEQFELTQWKTASLPADFDVSFWRPFLQTLIAQFKALPVTLRYDRVKLKRELINPDYEHLWLEFHDVVFGPVSWKKFEVRLGAALIQPGAFSLYPKFEIPLVDGKDKPFESWFSESYDDSGGKLELRFALERKIFDVAVWAKLSEADRAVVLRIIYAFPEALRRLESEKVSIHRPWKTWVEFARSAIQILDQLRASQAAQAKSAQTAVAQNVAQALPVTDSIANSQSAKLAPTSSPAPRTGPRVITFDAKPKAATKPKTQAKPDPKKSATKSTTKTAAKNAALKPAAKPPAAKKTTKK